ncbi:xylulokinase, partial [Candidatus Aerophobetes bacterium]|nr:xylulokinase [Candidatus Aerophobetes bacterium]
LEEFKELRIRPSSMVTSGGGAKSRLWRKILANVFNLPVFTVNVEEASAYGASMTASVGAGIFSTVEEACQEWVRKEEEIFPEPEKVRIYEEAYQVYRGLYCKLKDDFHVLSRLEATKL